MPAVVAASGHACSTNDGQRCLHRLNRDLSGPDRLDVVREPFRRHVIRFLRVGIDVVVDEDDPGIAVASPFGGFADLSCCGVLQHVIGVQVVRDETPALVESTLGRSTCLEVLLRLRPDDGIATAVGVGACGGPNTDLRFDRPLTLPVADVAATYLVTPLATPLADALCRRLAPVIRRAVEARAS